MWAMALGATMMALDFDERRADWRVGAVVYQVFTDRFVPPTDFDARAHLYPAPATRHPWSETPKGSPGPINDEWPHTYAFWGGTLDGVRTKLDYIQKEIGADVLYLNPIFEAPSNHKYDTIDYFRVDDQLGGDAAFDRLLKDCRSQGLRVMLDGVLNHCGTQAPHFKAALNDPKSKYRDWFTFDQKYLAGYKGWFNIRTLPAWNLENPAVRDYLWKGKDSVVQHYLRKGIDGWRLDVAFELGTDYLRELTEAAHKARKGSSIVGEISGYPSTWVPAVDGTFNFTPMQLARFALDGKLDGGNYTQIIEDMVHDAGIDALLQSWLLTDNHDTPRFATTSPKVEDRHLIRALQMTLPGSPCLYYGSELGMPGGGDPECRAPMRWDLQNAKNLDLQSWKSLSKVRRELSALRIGDFAPLRSKRLIAFVRSTDLLMDTAVVVMNPTNETVTESMASRVGKVLSWGELEDRLSGQRTRSIAGTLDLTLKPKEVRIYRIVPDTVPGYNVYERVKRMRG